MSGRVKFKPYTHPVGGWGSVLEVRQHRRHYEYCAKTGKDMTFNKAVIADRLKFEGLT